MNNTKIQISYFTSVEPYMAYNKLFNDYFSPDPNEYIPDDMNAFCEPVVGASLLTKVELDGMEDLNAIYQEIQDIERKIDGIDCDDEDEEEAEELRLETLLDEARSRSKVIEDASGLDLDDYWCVRNIALDRASDFLDCIDYDDEMIFISGDAINYDEAINVLDELNISYEEVEEKELVEA